MQNQGIDLPYFPAKMATAYLALMGSADNAVHLTMRIMALQLLARQCVAASLRLMVQLLGLPQEVIV